MKQHRLNLVQGDTVLGVLTGHGVDQPWFICEFAPTPAWESVRPVFEAWTAAAEDRDPAVEGIAAALQAVDDLGVVLVPPDGGPAIEDFLLHVRGDEARYRC